MQGWRGKQFLSYKVPSSGQVQLKPFTDSTQVPTPQGLEAQTSILFSHNLPVIPWGQMHLKNKIIISQGL